MMLIGFGAICIILVLIGGVAWVVHPACQRWEYAVIYGGSVCVIVFLYAAICFHGVAKRFGKKPKKERKMKPEILVCYKGKSGLLEGTVDGKTFDELVKNPNIEILSITLAIPALVQPILVASSI